MAGIIVVSSEFCDIFHCSGWTYIIVTELLVMKHGIGDLVDPILNYNFLSCSFLLFSW
jgi:hypothetical protein